MANRLKCVLLNLTVITALGLLLITDQAASEPLRTVHVFVALADNQHQGIVPVPAALGNGLDPARNLYWGAAYGVKSYFKASQDWELLSCSKAAKAVILERCIFRYRMQDVFLVADAYEGSHIREALTDFLSAAAGDLADGVSVKAKAENISVPIGGASDLVVYVGHDAFMDFQIPPISGKKSDKARLVIVLACASRTFFGPYLKKTGAEPLLWTTGLMAPEAYTLKAALDGWISLEKPEQIRLRSAQAYDKYQRCGIRAAQRLFAAGW